MTEIEALQIVSKSAEYPDWPWPVVLAEDLADKAALLNASLISLSGVMPACRTERDCHYAACLSVKAVMDGILSGEMLGIEARRIRTMSNNAARRSKSQWN